MRVDEVMTKDVKVCRATDTLSQAAQLMWEHDCGCVPVVDERGRAVGMITDRDICMAAYTRGRSLHEIRIGEIMARQVVACGADSSLASAEALMAHHQIRRLVVLGFENQLVGVLSLGDVARAARRQGNGHEAGLTARAIEDTLAAVCQPRLHHAVQA